MIMIIVVATTKGMTMIKVIIVDMIVVTMIATTVSIAIATTETIDTLSSLSGRVYFRPDSSRSLN
jgi:hypothetical protein